MSQEAAVLIDYRGFVVLTTDYHLTAKPWPNHLVYFDTIIRVLQSDFSGVTYFLPYIEVRLSLYNLKRLNTGFSQYLSYFIGVMIPAPTLCWTWPRMEIKIKNRGVINGNDHGDEQFL